MWEKGSMRAEDARSYPVSIFIAGEWLRAEQICRAYCDEIGLCVTVTPTHYIYTDGQEQGVIVGLINYPRFPSDPQDIINKASALADRLREGLRQESYSIQTPERTIWRSWRAADCPVA
jgi:hypothetical protein